jgi:hypothetical protein
LKLQRRFGRIFREERHPEVPPDRVIHPRDRADRALVGDKAG